MIQLLNNIYAVPVPDDLSINDEWIYMGKIMPFDKFEVLGTCTSTDIDFDIQPYIESEKWDNEFGYGITYKNYTDDDNLYLYPELSFRSLLTSKGVLFENSIKDPCKHNSYCVDFCQGSCQTEYNEAQQEIVEKIVIIKKL